MDKNKIITVLCILVGLLTIALIVMEIRGKKTPEPVIITTPQGPIEVREGNEDAPSTDKPEWKKNPIKGGAVDALPKKRIVKNEFLITGKGYHAKWGRGLKAGFRQDGLFVAEATVVKREKLGNGRFKVVEDRKFLTAREKLEIGEADYFLALDTLPIDEISSVLDTVGNTVNTVSGFLLSTSFPYLEAAGMVTKTVGGVAELAASSLRHFKLTNNEKALKDFGIDMTGKAKAAVESKINDFDRKPKEMEVIVRKVEGRTYRFTYIQEGTGQPLNVTAERIENGRTTTLETEEEVWILCRCNAFIDADFLKDGGEKTPEPGEKWVVDARSVAGIVGVDGYCKGRLTCCRTDAGTDDRGLWEFGINPAELEVVDDSDKKLGKISVGGGKSTVYADGRTLRDVTIKGKGKLNRVNKNSILFLPFNEKFVGECDFAGKMTTEVK